MFKSLTGIVSGISTRSASVADNVGGSLEKWTGVIADKGEYVRQGMKEQHLINMERIKKEGWLELAALDDKIAKAKKKYGME